MNPPYNVRKALSKIRQRWDQHSPSEPLCLCEEVAPGVTISDFCVTFLLSQRARNRVVKTTESNTADEATPSASS